MILASSAEENNFIGSILDIYSDKLGEEFIHVRWFCSNQIQSSDDEVYFEKKHREYRATKIIEVKKKVHSYKLEMTF